MMFTTFLPSLNKIALILSEFGLVKKGTNFKGKNLGVVVV